MKRLSEVIVKMLLGLSKAVLRFPLTVFCLLCCTILTCYMISLHKTPDLIIQKLMFVFLLGAFIGLPPSSHLSVSGAWLQCAWPFTYYQPCSPWGII